MVPDNSGQCFVASRDMHRLSHVRRIAHAGPPAAHGARDLLESVGEKFFRRDAQTTPVCLLRGQPNCKGYSEVYVAVVLRQILRNTRDRVR